MTAQHQAPWGELITLYAGASHQVVPHVIPPEMKGKTVRRRSGEPLGSVAWECRDGWDLGYIAWSDDQGDDF